MHISDKDHAGKKGLNVYDNLEFNPPTNVLYQAYVFTKQEFPSLELNIFKRQCMEIILSQG